MEGLNNNFSGKNRCQLVSLCMELQRLKNNIFRWSFGLNVRKCTSSVRWLGGRRFFSRTGYTNWFDLLWEYTLLPVHGCLSQVWMREWLCRCISGVLVRRAMSDLDKYYTSWLGNSLLQSHRCLQHESCRTCRQDNGGVLTGCDHSVINKSNKKARSRAIALCFTHRFINWWIFILCGYRILAKSPLATRNNTAWLIKINNCANRVFFSQGFCPTLLIYLIFL